MQIRKLDTWQEWYASNRIIATAFLQNWDGKEAEEHFRAQAEGKLPRSEEAWGCFSDDGRMRSTIVTSQHRLTFDGQVLDAGEANMVGSLPEGRGGGHIRALMGCVLRDFKARGDVIAVLHPFSFAFYRKYGFELASSVLTQKAAIGQFAGFRNRYAVSELDGEEDIPVLQKLYEDYGRKANLCAMDKDWSYRGDGQFGRPDWHHPQDRQYTYLFRDPEGEPRAYLKFRFAEGPDGPFTGTMEISELVYDSPEALRNVLGFLYTMRAKIVDVRVALMDGLDLGTLLPECDKVERTLGGHLMMRVLDNRAMLSLMKHPEGRGSYTLRVEDAFLPENAGTYRVEYAKGRAENVTAVESDADLTVSIDTFSQLAIGLIDLHGSEYREGTQVAGNRPTLEKVFIRKPVYGG